MTNSMQMVGHKTLFFRSSLSVAFFFGTAILWVFSAFIFFRSRFRSDVASFAFPTRFNVTVGCDEGLFGVGLYAPQFGKHTSFRWTSGLPYSPMMSPDEGEKLSGTDLRWIIQTNLQANPSNPKRLARYVSWGSFSCGYESGDIFYYKNEVNTEFAYRYRNLPRPIGLNEVREFDLISLYHGYFVSVPIWALPAGLAVPPALWLLTAGRRRWRSYRLAKSGRCTNCGYDLRESPTKCPECGLEAVKVSNGAREWRVAFYGVSAALVGIAVFFNRLNPVEECKPSTDDRRMTHIGMAIPWNPEAEHPDLIKWILGDNGPYTVRLDFASDTLTILRNDRIICTWHERYNVRENWSAAFKIYGDVLYRQDKGPGTRVAKSPNDFPPVIKITILAIDLQDGHQIWASDLVEGRHSQWGTHQCLDVRNDRVIFWDDDPSGRIAEAKDIHTGKTVGYCTYDR